MHEKFKKAVSIFSAGILAMGILAGCGSQGTTAAVNDQSSSSQETTLKAEHKAEMTLVSFAGKSLTVEYEGKEYTLDISKAIINTNVMHSGDKLIVYYDGELGEDTSKFTVISVENTSSEDSDSNEIVGTLEEITMNSITIRTNDGRIITFNANNAEHSFSYGVNEGNWVTVIYDGQLKGTDTTNLAVTKIHDEDTEHVKQVKAQTTIEDVDDTVYALERVYVHSSYMMASEVVGEIEAGQALRRTGRCNNGWDRIIFNEKEAYVYGSLLTKNSNEVGMKGTLTSLSQKVNIKSLSETVYAKTDANVRENYSTASSSIGALKAGSSVTRTGICDNGWSRIDYNGRDAYVYSDLLTTKNPNTEVEGVTITAVNETIFAVTDANVRESFSVDSKAVGALRFGENAVRTGICSNGWSRIIYNNKDAYVNSDLISKTNPVEVKTVKIYVTRGYAWATTDANIRESFTSDSKAIGLLKKDEGIEVTGVTDNNWTRVNYNGRVGYIHVDLLTNINPHKEESAKPTTAPTKPATATPKPTAKPATATPKPTTAPATATPEPIEEPVTPTVTPDSTTEPDDSSASPAEPTVKTDDSGTEESVIDESPEESLPEAIDDSTEDSSVNDSSVSDESADGSTAERPKDEDSDRITGTVVGYDIDTVTIKVDDDSDSKGDDSVAEEPHRDEPEDAEDEYPSTTYEEAEGEESTYYTFDITDASQEYSEGISEGNEVTVSYTGNLDDMEDVKATNVADSDAGSSASSSVFRGSVVSTTGNTVTIKTDEDVSMTFNYASIADLGLAEGERVKITANMNKADNNQTVFDATNVERA